MKKKNLLSLLALVLGVPAAVLLSGSVPLPVQKDASALLPDGERKAIARGLYGRIELVKSPAVADYKVYVTNNSSSADLLVQIVDGLANSPGRWQIVKGAPDFRVYIANNAASADLLIYFVNAGPGHTR